MSKKGTAKGQPHGDLVAREQGGASRGKPLGASELMMLRPSDVIVFSVYDHEETKLFGVMRDEMIVRRDGEPEEVWLDRCDEVRDWNRRRSQLMTAVFINKLVEKYEPDVDTRGILRLTYGLATGPDFLKGAWERYGLGSEVFRCLAEACGFDVKALRSGDATKLLEGGV